MTSKVALYVSNYRAYVWSVEDLATLRAQHHICGLLVGTLPHLSQQNMFLGVPLILMPEEVVLLVEKEFAVLVDDPNAHHTPPLKDLRSWVENRDREMKSNLSRLEESKEGASVSKGMTDDAIKKRREREEKRASARAKAVEAAGDGPGPSAFNVLDTSQSFEPAATGTPVSTFAVTIPTTSSDFAWHDCKSHSYETIDAAMKAGIWSYPGTLHERAKCHVFQDLWEKGYFMGGGMKFGGDYLIYPGDPLRYHSHFVASVFDSPTSTLRPMQIVAYGRLGTATKKAHVLCGWDDDAQEVSYHSIEWAGFG